MNTKYLNFGCGDRLGKEPWVNIDFHSTDRRVIQCNLLGGFPFDDASFDAVYSSHVLEHFTKEQGAFLLGESFRVLKPGGIVRIVVPDLESTCREYVRVLDCYEHDELARRQHEWLCIELMDQMVRTTPGGMVLGYREKLLQDNDQEMIAYVRGRTQSGPWRAPQKSSLGQKLGKLSMGKVKEKLAYIYLKILRLLYPPALRCMALDEAPLGEKHRWMYDRFSLSNALALAGFREIRLMTFNTSQIKDFNDYFLDVNPDGTSYKNNSLYMEGIKLDARV